MAHVHLGPRVVTLPRWPTLMLALFALLGVVSLAQGVVDILIPTLTGGQPFGFLFAITETYGPVAFALYIYAHNLGLACLVPGFGFVASRYEKRTANRAIIGWLLAGSVMLSLLVGLEYLLQASHRFDLRIALPLFALEAFGVLLLAIPAARMMQGFVPTPAYAWSLVTPFRRLSGPLVVSSAILAAASAFETWLILG